MYGKVFPSKNLSGRYSKYLGVSGNSVWGPIAAGFPIDALRGHGDLVTTCLDFTETFIPNDTALAAAPHNWTVTSTGAGSPSIVGNSLNGYLLINPGTVADTGYGLVANKANLPTTDLLGFTGQNANSTISGGASTGIRDLYWGARVAIASNATWDGALFMGYSALDTTPLSTTTGTVAITQHVGISIPNTGVLSLSKATGGTSTAYATSPVVNVSSLYHTSTNFRSQDFHDYFVHIRYNGLTGSTGQIRLYLDGDLIFATASNITLLALNSTGTYYNHIALFNGDAGLVDMAVSHIINGYTRYHITG